MADWRIKLRDHFNGRLLISLTYMLHKTTRYQIDGLEKLQDVMASEKPVVLSAWHGLTLAMAGWFLPHYEPDKFGVLMPDDWRGSALAYWAHHVGAQAFQMDVTAEGGMATARKLTSLVREIKKGVHTFITPDGPHGPAYEIKPGVAFIAKKAKATLLPMGAFTRFAFRLNRWDQYYVPLPFGRISIAIGDPISTSGSREEIIENLTNALHRASAKAAANFYEDRHE